MENAKPDLVRFAIEKGYSWHLGRHPAPAEIDAWQREMEVSGLDRFDVVERISRSQEAHQKHPARRFDAYETGPFIQLVYLLTKNRLPDALEIERQRIRLAGTLTRQNLFDEMSMAAFAELEATVLQDTPPSYDPGRFRVMGTTRMVGTEDWTAAKEDLADRAEDAPPAVAIKARQDDGVDPAAIGGFAPLAKDQRVSVLVSLYKAGQFIESFLDSMIAQTIFEDHVDVIIVDAASPEGEASAIQARQAEHPNILYRRLSERVTVYEAWNTAIGMAHGSYLTNANLDDLRRPDSLEIQARILSALPFVDVVYQDFLYTLDYGLGFDHLSQIGIKSDLPLVTPENIMRENAPHNAPMWRRSLHDDLGLFDPAFHSAADNEFWARAALAGKCFYKSNSPHTAYFQNADGLSTRRGSRGPQEAREIWQRHGRAAVDEAVICNDAAFLELLGGRFDSPPSTAVSRAEMTHRALVGLAAARWPERS
ncbi:glycosyltransferase [Aliiroseovarius sp.]|uniref:glycosyltransferase n=1 Tax=Aliiroseovarius sp. TaxID=1872442 RepID=UPI0026343495|nr:glycosyltransferase [Aliiroseovarius sp.]